MSIKQDFPNSGEIMVQGHLRAQGINVQRSGIRATIRDVDPQSVIARQCLQIHHCVYSVPCPNYLWQVDGNHKLIQWALYYSMESMDLVV